jgi:hypothetical protein
MSYDKYIIWMRLTHNGRRSRAEMSPQDQAEYDAQGYGDGSESRMTPEQAEEAKRAYEALTQHSPPASSATT